MALSIILRIAATLWYGIPGVAVVVFFVRRPPAPHLQPPEKLLMALLGTLTILAAAGAAFALPWGWPVAFLASGGAMAEVAVREIRDPSSGGVSAGTLLYCLGHVVVMALLVTSPGQAAFGK